MGDSVANYRHDLLTPVNQIIGYCEILIEDAEGSDQEAVLTSLKSILEQGRNLLQEIERAFPGTAETSAADLPALRVQLQATLSQILEACDGLHWGADAQALAGFAEDLGKVRAAAANLVDLTARLPDSQGAVPGPPG